MEREPSGDADAGTHAGTEAAETPPPHPRPRIDVSPALHEAGHEVADLGYEGIPDTGPVLHAERGHAGPDDPLDFVNVQMPAD